MFWFTLLLLTLSLPFGLFGSFTCFCAAFLSYTAITAAVLYYLRLTPVKHAAAQRFHNLLVAHRGGRPEAHGACHS